MRTIEALQVETTLRLALPQTQVVGVLGGITRNHDIVRDSKDFLSTAPHGLHAVEPLRVAVEAHIVSNVRTRKLPRVVVLEPRVGRLKLAAVRRDQLLEDT